jgi:hypothetical protein
MPQWRRNVHKRDSGLTLHDVVALSCRGPADLVARFGSVEAARAAWQAALDDPRCGPLLRAGNPGTRPEGFRLFQADLPHVDLDEVAPRGHGRGRGRLPGRGAPPPGLLGRGRPPEPGGNGLDPARGR